MYIIKSTKAPVQHHSRSGRSKWRDLFEEMKVGEWFVLPKADHAKAQNAGFTYLKGRYSLYKHPTMKDYYVFLKVK